MPIPSDITLRFAQRLKASRTGRGYKTARKFAERLGIHENRYTRYERAEVEPDLETLMEICTHLGLTPNDLLCETPGLQQSLPDADETLGFEEASASFQTAPSTDQTSGNGQSIGDIKYKLCSILALALLRKDLAGAEPPPYRVLGLAGDLFKRMNRNHHDVIADIGTAIDISATDLETQAQIASLVAELISKGNDGTEAG